MSLYFPFFRTEIVSLQPGFSLENIAQLCIIVEFLPGHIFQMVVLAKKSAKDRGLGVVSRPLFIPEVVYLMFHPEYDV